MMCPVIVFLEPVNFALLSGGDIFLLDGRLAHKFLEDGNVSIFKIVGLGEDPLITCGRLLDVAVHGGRVLDLLYIVEDTGGRTIYQEYMVDLDVDFWDDVVIR